MKRKVLRAICFFLGFFLGVALFYLARGVTDRISAAKDQAQAEELSGFSEPSEAPTQSVLRPAPSAAQSEPGQTDEGKEEPPASEPGASPSPAPAPYGQELVDIPALQAVNPEVIGWLWIPDTGISYPLVQGTDNRYYLNHTWTGAKNRGGAIFMDSRCGMGDRHMVIYGHRMMGGSMFGSLSKYSKSSYLKEHRDVYVITEGGTEHYRIYAAYEAETGDGTYRLSWPDEESWSAYLASEGLAAAGSETKLLTLSTCTAAGSKEKRWVVRAIAQQ